MDSELFNFLTTQGIFALLFGYLLLYILKQNQIREENYQKIIQQLNGVASGKCGFHTLRAFSPLIPMVCRLFTNYSYTLSIIYNKLFSLTLKSPLLLYYL